MMFAPCRDCENRHVGCHSDCEKYKEFVIANEERKEAIRKGKEMDRFFVSNASRRLDERIRKEKKRK